MKNRNAAKQPAAVQIVGWFCRFRRTASPIPLSLGCDGTGGWDCCWCSPRSLFTSRCGNAEFIWDDDTFLTDNPVLKQADGLYHLWFTASTPDYFPMTSCMLWLEWRIWGNHPLRYHLVNVLLHAFRGVFWWRVLMRLRVPEAWLAAALWPRHSPTPRWPMPFDHS